MSFKWLHQKCFDHEHDGDECQSISQDARHVEQLERNPNLEADPIRAPQQLGVVWGYLIEPYAKDLFRRHGGVPYPAPPGVMLNPTHY